MNKLLLALALLSGSVFAQDFEAYKAQEDYFTIEQVGSDALLTWQQEIVTSGRSRVICSSWIEKNGDRYSPRVSMRPVYPPDVGTPNTLSITGYVDTDEYKLKVGSCGGHYDVASGKKHRHAGRHTEILDPVSDSVDPPVDPPVIDPPTIAFLQNIDTSGNLDTRTEELALPGATGPAMFSRGGAGGVIYTINTTGEESVNGDGLISWEEFINSENEVQSHARTAVFSVSGEINIGTRTDVFLQDSNVSILCHTAPSPGIVFTGMQSMVLKHDSDNIQIRFCKFKPKDTLNAGDNTTVRLINSVPSSIGAADNIYIDHVSGMYGTDDGITFWQNTDESKKVPANITIAHSLLGEGATTCVRTDNECGSSSTNTGQEDWRFPSHSAAITLSSRKGEPIKNAAVVANLMMNTWARAPQIRSVTGADVRNNWIANNYGTAITLNQATGPLTVAPSGWITGNWLPHGPDTTNPENFFNLSGGDIRYIINDNHEITYPANGVGQGAVNEIFTNATTTLPGNPIRYTDEGNNTILVDADDVPICVGASVPFRDASDRRLVAEVNGLNTDSVLPSAEIGIGTREPYDSTKCSGPQCFYFAPGIDGQGQRNYSEYVGNNVRPASYDTDLDGIPDSYEQVAIDDDPNDAYATLADIDHTTKIDGDHYYFAEEVFNHMAASCARGET